MSNHKPELSDYVDLGELYEPTEISELDIVNDDSRSCPDCGVPVGRYYGPLDFDGNTFQTGDYVCRHCAVSRGVEVTG